MRVKSVLIFILLLLGVSLYGYQIQQISITFIDPSRNNRQIPTQIFIPVDPSVRPMEEGSFPFIVFGHGWIQSYTVYQAIWEALVPLGWIMAFPTTEGNLFPSHQQFALDLAFLSFAIPQAGENPSSPLYNLVDPIAIAMGHSMGGGASVLAASGTHNFSAMATLAAANTNPSAVNAALNVTIPSLTFSGTSDSIAPPSSHQIPIYNNLASIYKSFISLNGVTHTGINSNGIVFSLLEPWLEYIMNGEGYYLALYESMLDDYQVNGNVTYLIENYLPPENLNILIADGWLTISWDKTLGAEYYIVEATTNPDLQFFDVSSETGIFSEDDIRVFWSIQIDENEPRLFYRVKALRNLL